MSLASNLGMDVIAEGVETLEQATKLRTFGCAEGQGFFFSKPIPVDKADQLLRETAPLVPTGNYYGNVESIASRFVA